MDTKENNTSTNQKFPIQLDLVRFIIVIVFCIGSGYMLGTKLTTEERAEKDYEKLKTTIQESIQNLSTIKLKLPVDIGWNNGVNADSSCWTKETYYHQVSIEDLMTDARACIEYSTNEELKKKARIAFQSGIELDNVVFNYIDIASSCLSAYKKDYERRNCDSQLNKKKAEITEAASEFSKAMEAFYANRDENREGAGLFKAYRKDNLEPYNNCHVPYKQANRFDPSLASFYREKYPELFKKYWKY